MRALLLAAALTLPGAAAAQTGNDWVQLARGDAGRVTIALQLVRTVMEAEQATADRMLGVPGWGPELPWRMFCTPPGVTVGQAFDVVAAWIDANPQARHASAYRLSRAALINAWPCRGNAASDRGAETLNFARWPPAIDD